MKKIAVLIVGVVCLSILLSGCGKNTDPIKVSPLTDEVTGDLEDCLYIFEDEYNIKFVNNDGVFDKLIISIKVEVLEEIDEYEEFSSLYLEIVDESGAPITEAGTFTLHQRLSNDFNKLNKMLEDGDGEAYVTFDNICNGGKSAEEIMDFLSDGDGNYKFTIHTVIQDKNGNKQDSSDDFNDSEYEEQSPLELLAEDYYLDDYELEETELHDYNKETLRIMRNWIFAKHGRKFKSKDLQEFFSQFDWYKPKNTNISGNLTKIEKENIEILKKAEKNAESGIIDFTNSSYNKSNSSVTSTSSSSSSSSTTSDTDWGDLLDDYEDLIDDYIDLLEKANDDDMSAVSAMSLMSKATELYMDAFAIQEKLMNAEDELSISQITKLTKLQLKFAKKAADLSK